MLWSFFLPPLGLTAFPWITFVKNISKVLHILKKHDIIYLQSLQPRQKTQRWEKEMKIKTIEKSYEQVVSLPPEKHKKPKRPNWFWRILMYLVSKPDLWAVRFRSRKIGMERLGKREPCLVLMNHSSFVDLEIAATVLFPRPFNIVATTDSFVGKNWLMRQIGCIPTKKFVTELSLIHDITYATKTLGGTVLMYPEASYSFDGTATPLPDSIGKFVKRLGVPVVMIRTYGAFSRDPLYNNLQRRKVQVSADVEYLLSPEELEKMSAEEIREIINQKFTFDNFRWQQENRIKITEPFRADFLNRVLYKCPACQKEGQMKGEGIKIRCKACGKEYELDEYGFLRATEGKTEFSHIPDWYAWERESVKKELLSGEYRLDVPVDICMAVDAKHIFRVGEGRLVHNTEGFHLTGCDGKLDYFHSAVSSYSLYSDFNWYEIGDVICIGNHQALYYCFPKVEGDIVAKTRLAAEELYKIKKAEQREKKRCTV